MNARNEERWRGFRAGIPPALGVFTYGVVLGVLASGKDIGPVELAAMNALIFSGSAQFVLIGLWSGTLPFWQMALAATAVNLRYPLLTASIAPLLAPLAPLSRALRIHLLADENWAVSLAAWRRGEGGADHLLGSSLCVFLSWMAGTLAGALFGAFLGDLRTYGLDFAFTAVFTALTVSFWRGKGDLLPWGVAAAVSLLVSRLLPGTGCVLAGGLAGALSATLGGNGAERKGAGR